MSPANFDHELNSLIRRAKMKFPDAAKEDISNVLNNFKDLQPEVVNFTFPSDGFSRNCLSLTGTIPIHYKGSKYNIPVALYLLDNHPYAGPFCYVKPTSNMRIRASAAVDHSGRIYLPYLSEWQHPNYDTAGLLQVMTITFQEKCPVYSVGPTTTTNHNNNSSSNNSPTPPYPIGAASNQPPYPTRAAPNPPYPSSNPPYPTADVPPHLMPQPNVGSADYPPPAHFQQSPPYPPTPEHINPIPTASSSNPMLGAGYGYPTGTIQPTHIRASLLSAVEDKIKQKLRDKIGTPFAELQSIEANLRELHGGKQTLKQMLDDISRDQQELDRILGIYTAKKEELERALEMAKANNAANGTALDVEDAIDGQTPVHRQIIHCYVQDCSIDDTIYCLGRALKNGTINLQTYLKYVRQLSHQQFEHRLLMQKCRERARLPA